jgi:hypothetical protein
VACHLYPEHKQLPQIQESDGLLTQLMPEPVTAPVRKELT